MKFQRVFVGLWLGFSLLMSALAGTAFAAREKPRPPQFPDFDQTTVQHLIDTIEEPRNAMLLKIGYFARRREHPLPTGGGFELVKTAIEKAPVASKRWFLLQSVRAFAAFRASDVDTDEGFAAYAAIFDQVSVAAKVDAVPVVRQAIQDYAFSVVGSPGMSGLRQDERTQELLLKAWLVEAALGPEPPTHGRPRESFWDEAIAKSDSMKKFSPVIEKALGDTKVPKTYELLKIAAIVYRIDKPEQAIALLQQAKPLLPPDNATEARWLNDTLVELLVQTGEKNKPNLAKAVALRQEQIASTGHGYKELLLLQWRLGDKEAVQKILAALAAPEADEGEIVEVASALYKAKSSLHADAEAAKTGAEQATHLLQTYLNAQRKRGIEAESHARMLLGSYFIRQERITEAQKALDVSQLTEPPKSAPARHYLRAIKQMQESLDKKIENSVKPVP